MLDLGFIGGKQEREPFFMLGVFSIHEEYACANLFVVSSSCRPSIIFFI